MKIREIGRHIHAHTRSLVRIGVRRCARGDGGTACSAPAIFNPRGGWSLRQTASAGARPRSLPRRRAIERPRRL